MGYDADEGESQHHALIEPVNNRLRLTKAPREALQDTRDSTGEDALVAQLLDGDSETINEVRRWIRGACIPYRRHLAADLEDLEQLVLLELLEALRAGRFRGESRLATYVRRMVHYKCLNRVRDARRRTWVDVDDADLKATSPSPFEQVSSRTSVERALRVLALMSEACRDLWRMIHDDMCYREMSEQTGVTAGTLRVRVLRCRQRALQLRESLEMSGNQSSSRVTE